MRAVILSDSSIAKALADGHIVIDPLMDGAIQPSSVDLRVDRYFRVFRNDTTPFIDPKQPQEDLTELVEVSEGRAFILHPGEFVLGSTLERVRLADDLVARLEGKSSLGRLGLLIHSTAGFIDPGWNGHVTLELSNVANLPITIYPGMKIGQLSFVQLSEPAEKPYGSAGIGSTGGIDCALFNRLVGIEKIQEIPYRGSGPAMEDLIGRHFDYFCTISGSAAGPLQNNLVKGIAVFRHDRLPSVPRMPTSFEQGVNFEGSTWFAFFAPAKTPPEIIRKIHADTVAVVRDPVVKAKFERIGMVAVGSTPEELAAALKAETERWAPVIRQAKISLD